MGFNKFRELIAAQFLNMAAQGNLFRTAIDGDELWNTYLRSFPAGSDPIYIKRTSHDCGCCKQFIRAVGNVVAIIDGKVVSIWDVEGLSEEYKAVAEALSAAVKLYTIENVFVHYERTAGTFQSKQLLPNSMVKNWDHFFVNIPVAFVKASAEIGTYLGNIRSEFDVLKRALIEIDLTSIDTVIDLVKQGSLYRGEEHIHLLENFRLLKLGSMGINVNLDLYVWGSSDVSSAVKRFRNTVIGTLVTDIANGVGLEDAVKMFESKVAPTNYKRPTALVTPAMIKKAQETIQELGLMSALDRRYAALSDISVNNIIFANRAARSKITENAFDNLLNATPSNLKSLDRVEEISIEDFISTVVPNVSSIEVMLQNNHAGNLVSLIAPSDPTALPLFKWDNNFSWSYTGEVADSIKEKVKLAGGNVDGVFCNRLAWDYKDDLDLHMVEPDGNTIYFGNRRQLSRSGGMLDVDANGADGQRENPVENIFYKDKSSLKQGEYHLYVHNYSRRSDGKDFEVEIEVDGVTTNLSYSGILRNGEKILAATITYSKANGFSVLSKLTSTKSVKNLWSLSTQVFQKVDVIMLSPNHWDGKGIGNKHYFFMLDGCINPEQTRGFYNEFLNSKLDTHRKVFELVAGSNKVKETMEQLSGLGFSSTQKNSIIVKVEGSFTRMLKVNF